MGFLSGLEKAFFLRVIAMESFPLQSRLLFTLVEFGRLLSKDLFILLAFLTPFPLFSGAVKWAMTGVESDPLPLSAVTIVALVFLATGYVYGPGFLYDKFKGVLRYCTVWLDLLALPGIALSITMAKSPQQSSLMVVGNIVCIGILFAFSMLKVMFRVSKHYKTDNLTHSRLVPWSSLANLGNLTLVVVLSLKYDTGRGVDSLTKVEMVVFSLVFLGLTLSKLKQRLYLRYYLMDYANRLSGFFYLMELNAGILIGLYDMFALQLILSNLFFLEALMTGLAFLSLRAYQERTRTTLHLTRATDVKTDAHAFIYLDYLAELITTSSTDPDDVVLTMIRQRHIMACTDPACFCRRCGGKGEFFVRLVKGEIKEIERSFSADASVLLSALYFKVTMYADYPEALAALEGYSSKMQLSVFLRFFRQALVSHLEGYIGERNQNIGALECESVLELEGVKQGLERLIYQDLELRTKQWKYFSRRLCRVSELEEICNSGLQRIRGVLRCYLAHRGAFRRSKEFNLLLLYYFARVAFFTRAKEVRNCLKEISKDYKQEELHQLREFRRVIYSRGCCAVESRVEVRTVGVITHASRNIDEVFGRSRQELLGQNINAFMPAFMGADHDAVLRSWRESGTWRTMGKLKEVYCLHRDGHCFSALLYLKLVVKDDALHLLTNIFQLNPNDYMLLDHRAKIHAMGKQLSNILGKEATGLELGMLMAPQPGQKEQDSVLDLSETRVHERTLLSVREYREEVAEFKKRWSDLEGDRRKREEAEFSSRLAAENEDQFVIEFQVRRFSVGKLPFWVLQLKEAKTVRAGHSTFHLLEEAPAEGQAIRPMLSRGEEASSFESAEEEEGLLEAHGNSSMSSSAQKENYPLVKVVNHFQELVLEPGAIRDGRMGQWSLLVLGLVGLMVLLNLVSYIYYKENLLEVKGIFAADGTVSDMMQTVEMGYNNLFVLRSHLLANNSAFPSSLQSARHIQDFIYELMQDSLRYIVSEATPLTKTRLYGYVEKPAEWVSTEGTQKLQAKAFFRYMYHITNMAFRQLEENWATGSREVNRTLFDALTRNFQEMKRLNEFFLLDYQRLADLSHSLLEALTWGLMALFLLFSGALALLANHYFRFRFDQRLRSFAHFALLPSFFVEKMKSYYGELEAAAVEEQRLSRMERNEEGLLGGVGDAEGQAAANEGASGSKINLVNDDKYLKWVVILLVFAGLNAVNYLAISQIRGYLVPSKAVIAQINDLMRSENQLLESYFEMKEAYYLGEGMTTALYDRLMLLMRQDETKFASVVYGATNIFTGYDAGFKARFIKIVVDPVCPQGVAAGLSDFENQKCENELPLKLLDSGVIVAMNFFQRNVREAIEDLHLQHLGQRPQYQGDYFQQLQFTEIDQMLIYMFKIYQSTQAEAYDSYENGIELVTGQYLQIVALMAGFLLLLGVLWVLSLPRQKEALALLYGHLLLVPLGILKTNPRIVTMLKEAMEYTAK